MKRAMWMIGILIAVPVSLAAQEKQPPPRGTEEVAPQPKQPRQEYADFSRLLERMAVKRLPKEFGDASGWGRTVPAPADLRLARLRTFVKVGDALEVPHGAWRRFKGKIEDPDKNLKITVTSFKKTDDKTYRLAMDIDAVVYCQGEWQQWQKGLLLLGAKGDADANLKASVVCDVNVSLNLKTFPPELNIEPKVIELHLNLVDFKLRNTPPLLKDNKGEGLNEDLKEILRTLVKASEPAVKDHVNQAIVDGLKEGQGTISAGAILKSLPEFKAQRAK